MILGSFVGCLALFVLVGLASARRARAGGRDYYLAGGTVPAWLVGLSAVATNNSGYMFIGVIGFTYSTGLAAVWLMVGWIAGDFLGSLFIHRRLREVTAESGEVSYPAVMAGWMGGGFRRWRFLAALLMIAFLGAYSAAQVAAGGKALQGVLGWPPQAGAMVAAALILAYSIAGGIRASIWTDAAQSFVMIVAMTLLVAAALADIGGIGPALQRMGEINGFLDWFPADLLLPGGAGVGLFVLGWMFAGYSVVGQPHVMVRFMALDDPDNLVRARVWYYTYFTLFYLLATAAGLLSRLYLPELAADDPELALPTMALGLLPGVLVGIILAGIFAATMSTADSLILSCSAAVTHDLAPQRLESPIGMKATTAAVTALALALALAESSSVFNLVILAWSALASAFAPLLTLLALRRRIGEPLAIALMVLGPAIAAAWRWAGWQDALYEGLPGILLPLAIGWAATRPANAPAADRELGPRPAATEPRSP